MIQAGASVCCPVQLNVGITILNIEEELCKHYIHVLQHRPGRFSEI
jgi:hypothetical protein